MPTQELNPNHPMTQAMRERWQVIVALLVHKYSIDGEVVIDMLDFKSLPKNSCITVQEKEDGLHVKLLDYETAMELAKKEGGLPT